VPPTDVRNVVFPFFSPCPPEAVPVDVFPSARFYLDSGIPSAAVSLLIKALPPLGQSACFSNSSSRVRSGTSFFRPRLFPLFCGTISSFLGRPAPRFSQHMIFPPFPTTHLSLVYGKLPGAALSFPSFRVLKIHFPTLAPEEGGPRHLFSGADGFSPNLPFAAPAGTRRHAPLSPPRPPLVSFFLLSQVDLSGIPQNGYWATTLHLLRSVQPCFVPGWPP